MRYDEKRAREAPDDSAQSGNRAWWTAHTMSYDWRAPVAVERFSQDWFDEIDRRFLHASRLFGDPADPFGPLMGLADLSGKRVLEIGCGMGLHAEMLTRAGARLVAVDLSETSIAATRARFSLKRLDADIRLADAERLDLPDGAFDMVWSWGVIHHSARTGRAVREIERVLAPGGPARLMVYNLEGMPAYAALTRRWLAGFWRGRSLDEILWRSTDGYSARFYTRDLWTDLLATFFADVETSVLGAEPDALPLPGALRRRIVPFVSQHGLARRAQARGAFLFSIARKQAAP